MSPSLAQNAPLPETMEAISIREPGGPEVLELVNIPLPILKDQEILVKVAAAAINRGDIIQRMGFYPAPPGASLTPGLEAAGTVVAVGKGVTKWSAGDEVMALLAGGGYAQYCSVHEDHALAIPKNFSMKEAGATPESIFTVWTNVFEDAALKAGETLLIHGGTSGIGSMAIQMAKVFGATVYATAGSEEKCKACEAFGADRAINYKEEDFVLVTKDLTDNVGADVIFDMVGGDYIQRNITTAARRGRIVNIAYQSGSVAEVNFLPIMLKRLVMTGSTLRARSIDEKTALTQAITREVMPHLTSGALKPIVHKTFPLSQAADAQILMESSAHIGKIVLIP
jgi:NADPH2:quinone reductase